MRSHRWPRSCPGVARTGPRAAEVVDRDAIARRRVRRRVGLFSAVAARTQPGQCQGGARGLRPHAGARPAHRRPREFNHARSSRARAPTTHRRRTSRRPPRSRRPAISTTLRRWCRARRSSRGPAGHVSRPRNDGRAARRRRRCLDVAREMLESEIDAIDRGLQPLPAPTRSSTWVNAAGGRRSSRFPNDSSRRSTVAMRGSPHHGRARRPHRRVPRCARSGLRPRLRRHLLAMGRRSGSRSGASAAGGRSISTRDRSAVRVPTGVELDFGATAKALCVDRGGERDRGRNEQRRAGRAWAATSRSVALAATLGWSVVVTDDHAASPDEGGQRVRISAGGLATSGTTVRRWQRGDDVLHHVVDPATGLPAEEHWRTVTVAAATCVDANIASTAALVMGARAPQWLSARGLPARLIAPDGAVTRVCSWPAEADEGLRC